ncbi:DNA-binding protein excisionase family [Dehalogenimonas sp. WBC-2]|nr:DNA-binding protein excisionase family [Dehalogenimonas sp. WBC-2]
MGQPSSRPAVTPMLTTSEVAVILNVHINTVRRWSNQGTLKSFQLGPRGDRRFRREDIDVFLASHQAGSNEAHAQDALHGDQL